MTIRRLILRCAAAASLALVLYGAVTIGEGYVRAPAVVARQVRETPLDLMPEELTPEQIRSLLAVEDPAFLTHHGIDLRTPGAGMTTISQGLVKFLYFERFRPGIAKIRQSLLAIGFDARISKETQLALFLNAGYLGTFRNREVRGFADAARAYFDTDFNRLSRAQYLSLVAMCIGPDQFSVAEHPAANQDRVARIERLLSGECRPGRWLDVYYEACAPGGTRRANRPAS